MVRAHPTVPAPRTPSPQFVILSGPAWAAVRLRVANVSFRVVRHRNTRVVPALAFEASTMCGAANQQAETLMKIGLISAIVVAAVLAAAGGAFAQSSNAAGEQPPAKQSAPPEAPHAAGHDAQTGQPETGPNATQSQNPGTSHDVDGTESKSRSKAGPGSMAPPSTGK